jgi:hypothetical protein
MHVCPVDLRKLHHSIGFDVVTRYVTLLQFYDRPGFDDERDWTRARLEWILGETASRELIERSGKHPE